MKIIDHKLAVKQGYWFYAGINLCPVKIVNHQTLYGTLDPTDPPEIALDQAKNCYYVLYHIPSDRELWRDGGVALSLSEAVFIAELKLGPTLQWSN